MKFQVNNTLHTERNSDMIGMQRLDWQCGMVESLLDSLRNWNPAELELTLWCRASA
jgi:hypothetical protein